MIKVKEVGTLTTVTIRIAATEVTVVTLVTEVEKKKNIVKVFDVLKNVNILLFSESCSTTTRGIHSTSFQAQLISFHLGALGLFLPQETEKRDNMKLKAKPPL